MSFVVKRHSLAEDDAAHAALWYEAQSPGLGSDFLDEVEAAFDALKRDALLHSVRFSVVRCMRLKRFKAYGVYYVVKESEVWILAVLHGAREVEKLIGVRK